VGGGFREDAYGLLSGFVAGSYVAGYRLQERVGAGGMAVVFRALDERLDRPVALKILAPALAADEVFRRRFIREAKAAAAVDDPHIIPVFEAGEAGGALFIAMRFVPGGDVRSLVRRAGALAAGRVAGIVSSVASALDAAHDAGLVHRDVKPANILVDARPGRPDHVYLSDFGLCQGALSFSGPGRRGQFLGTIGYAAPEQIRGGPVDGRADQYALACTAFELLSGAPPFPRDRPDAVIWGHVSQPPPLLTSRRPGFPAAADGVLTRALAKAPGDRYASCQDFADALRAALSLAPPSREVAIGLQDDHWQAGTTWPSIGDAEPAEDAPVAAAAARVSRGRGELQPSTVGRGLRTVPPGPATRPKQARHARARTRPPHRNRRRFRLSVMPAAMLAMVLSVLGALAQLHPVLKAPLAPTIVPVAEPASYLGVYVPGRPAYRPVADFAAAAGQQPNLAGYVTAWGEPFAASFARTLGRHGVVPLVQIDPTLAAVSAIASGADDGYLRSYADSVRDYGHPVVIGFGHEMNATWYSWGYTRIPAPTFVAAWRHVVMLFRQQGADNVTWLWTIQADQPGTGPIRSWWPGMNYVTWVGIDGFYTRPSDTFSRVFVPTIEQVRTFSGKPILLSETAVPRRADQYTSIINLFDGMARYGILGLVWFDQDESQQTTPPGGPGVAGQDWRLEDSPLAEQAFRLGISGMRLVQP
jgi:Protein kinase domain/Glycosyl hydrolase family 26